MGEEKKELTRKLKKVEGRVMIKSGQLEKGG